jgi:hypothetical protein
MQAKNTLIFENKSQKNRIFEKKKIRTFSPGEIEMVVVKSENILGGDAVKNSSITATQLKNIFRACAERANVFKGLQTGEGLQAGLRTTSAPFASAATGGASERGASVTSTGSAIRSSIESGLSTVSGDGSDGAEGSGKGINFNIGEIDLDCVFQRFSVLE